MLAQNGKAMVKVLIADSATQQEEYAAAELRHYLNLMTATAFDLVKPEELAEQDKIIAIGSAAEKLGIALDASLGEDGFTIKTLDGNIAITGGKRGVIYGVYELLEAMGCRFFTPTSEKIPCKPSLPLPMLNTTQKPVIEYRLHSYKDLMQFPRFAVKSRINARCEIPEDFGGSIQYAWFVHSFEREIITPDEYFDSNPEYFSMVDGVRKGNFSQLCLTNPDVLKITVEKVRTALRNRPDCKIISVSQNDWYFNCTCPPCAELDLKEKSNAGSLIYFVNQVAEQIEAEFPDVVIDTLAYNYSRQAPKNIRPRHNVCVRLCSIECCFSHSFEACDDDTRKTLKPDGTRSHFIEDLREWAKVCDRLYIWDYTTGFAHYPAPHANWGVLQPNMQSFVKNNVKGVFEQACGALGGSTDLNELRAYIICKLLWDADCDIEKHMQEFTDFYYGAAAPYILEYIKVISEKVEKDNIHTGFNDQCDKPYLTDEMLDIYEGIFEKAEQAVIGDALRHARVAKARLSFRWVRIKNNQMLKNIVDPDEVNKFFEDWRAHGLTRIDEWVNSETTLRALLENKWRGTEFYMPYWNKEGKERL